MKRVVKWVAAFAIGAAGYAVVEIIYRGHTHWSMMIAGGVCFIIFSVIAKRLSHIPLVCRAVIAAMAVTAVEFIFGVIFNIIFKMGVWDYSNQVCNLCGQICPLFSFLWCGLAFLTLPLASLFNKSFE